VLLYLVCIVCAYTHSASEKRILLTDIIAHATSDKPSMIEVAYELLQDEGSTDGGLSSQTETAEEFAEQCKIFASDIQSGRAVAD
jgi:hypothetical protein